MERIPRKNTTYPDIDMTVPVDTKKLKEENCFGILWSIEAAECAGCADCELCIILTSEKTNKKVKEVESKGETFLDRTNFELINEEALIKTIGEGLPIDRLIKLVGQTAQCSDEVACIEWIKNFIREKKKIHTKAGVAYVRDSQ